MEGRDTDVAQGKQATGRAVTGRADSTLGETARSLWSVAICAHLFAVAVALSANLNRSPLQDRILNAKGLRTYLQLLYWDSPYLVGYQLTHAMEAEDDHQLVLEPIAVEGGPFRRVYPGLVYPDHRFWRGGFNAQRLRNLLGRLAAYAEQDDGEALSEFLGAVHGSLRGTGGLMREVRLERLTPLPLDAQLDGDREERQEVFIGDAWRDMAGVVRVNRRVDRTDAALVSPQSASPQSASPQSASPASPSAAGGDANPKPAGP